MDTSKDWSAGETREPCSAQRAPRRGAQRAQRPQQAAVATLGAAGARFCQWEQERPSQDGEEMQAALGVTRGAERHGQHRTTQDR